MIRPFTVPITLSPSTFSPKLKMSVILSTSQRSKHEKTNIRNKEISQESNFSISSPITLKVLFPCPTCISLKRGLRTGKHFITFQPLQLGLTTKKKQTNIKLSKPEIPKQKLDTLLCQKDDESLTKRFYSLLLNLVHLKETLTGDFGGFNQTTKELLGGGCFQWVKSE